jgi:hypothetical protein
MPSRSGGCRLQRKAGFGNCVAKPRPVANFGSLLKVLPDGYLVSRAEDHKVCLVHGEKVVYVEINW